MTATNEALKAPLMAMVNRKFDKTMRKLELKRLNPSYKEVADLREFFLDGVLLGLDMFNTNTAPIDRGDNPKPPPKIGGKCLSI